jgi:hypothetical protein
MPDQNGYIIVSDTDGGFLLCKKNETLSQEVGVDVYVQEQYYHELRTILRDEFDIKMKEENEDEKG